MMRDASEVRTMNCEKYQNLLSDFIDGSLAQDDHHSVATHLSGCGVCSEARDDLGHEVRVAGRVDQRPRADW